MPEDNQPPARSVADASIRAATRFEDVVAAARAYVLTAKLAAADGITWAEFGELLTGLLRTSHLKPLSFSTSRA
jgi:hypothetical protein